ncbi:MAG: nucleotidyltransferase family protein [Legionellaceae bacterium]|nr:nucleotidyltransferase family protein [Legionellaceae bacterium]
MHVNENHEFKLILHTLQSQFSSNELILDPAIDWPLFYKLVLRHRIWHQVHDALINQTPSIPIAAALTQHCKRDKRRIFITAGETVRIAREFTKKAIEHCFVKGTLLNVHVYGGLNTRPCRDIDVWVDANTYSSAVAALLSLGYQKKLPTYELSGFKERWYMRNKHDMAFYHPKQHVLVELHFRLSYFGLDFFPLSAITRKPINLLNVPILAPHDDYHLLYLMIHGAIHAWIRLRWLQDIALFINNNQCDLERVYDLATEIKCQHIVEQALILVNHHFKLTDRILAQLIHKPSHRGIKLAAIAQQFITADYEMTDGIRNINLFFKYRVYLAKLAVHGQKLHAIVGDLFKIDELFLYVTFPEKISFMYYVIYPLWIIKYVMKSLTRSRFSSNIK